MDAREKEWNFTLIAWVRSKWRGDLHLCHRDMCQRRVAIWKYNFSLVVAYSFIKQKVSLTQVKCGMQLKIWNHETLSVSCVSCSCGKVTCTWTLWFIDRRQGEETERTMSGTGSILWCEMNSGSILTCCVCEKWKMKEKSAMIAEERVESFVIRSLIHDMTNTVTHRKARGSRGGEKRKKRERKRGFIEYNSNEIRCLKRCAPKVTVSSNACYQV